jgi:hypothetical protein
METGYKMREIEQKWGNLHDFLPGMVETMGQAETARILGVSQFTIWKWLKDHDYRQVIRYEKAKEA